MKITDSSWQEAEGFLRGLGFEGDLLQKPGFRADSERFLEILLEKNQVLNLTGAKDVETLFWKHLVDSLALLSVADLGITADWGCGGGFPGIPLSLARKHMGDSTETFFLDSVGKKVRAVEEFCQALDLTRQTKCLVGRGEDLIAKGVLKEVRTAVMRAVAPPERAITWMSAKIPSWIFFLGPSQAEGWRAQQKALQKLKLEITEERSFALPKELGERCLIRISKRST